jgi:RNA polymerase sigma-70 factor (ECF subfamily)
MHDLAQCQKFTDEELVVRSREKSDFFGCLVYRYEKKLLGYIRRITNVSFEEGEDILQESFIKAYRNIYGFDENLSFSSWMYRIVYHEVIRNYRKRSVRPEGNIIDIDDESLHRIASDEDVIKNIEKKDKREYIKNIINRLDNKYKEVIILYYFEDKNYSEMADILEKPPGTVATLLSRAKKKLHTLFLDL